MRSSVFSPTKKVLINHANCTEIALSIPCLSEVDSLSSLSSFHLSNRTSRNPPYFTEAQFCGISCRLSIGNIVQIVLLGKDVLFAFVLISRILKPCSVTILSI